MSLHSFPNFQSSSQATLVCYRGPGCATQYRFDNLGRDFPVVSTLAEAQALASKDFRDQCWGFFIDDLSDTPFGNLALPEYTGGFAEICSGIVDDDASCKFDDHIALLHLTGPEGSLRVDMSAWQLFSVEPICVDSVQVVNGSCTWYGTHVECADTSATLGLAWGDSARRCCGKLGQDLAQSECTGSANALNPDTCQNEGPPIGFETDPSCITFDQFNSNVERKPIQIKQSFLAFDGSCDDYTTTAASSPTDSSVTLKPTSSPSSSPISLEPTSSPSSSLVSSEPTSSKRSASPVTSKPTAKNPSTNKGSNGDSILVQDDSSSSSTIISPSLKILIVSFALALPVALTNLF